MGILPKKEQTMQNKVTVTNTQAQELKKQAMDKLNEIAPQTEQVNDIAKTADKAVASQAQKSGLAARLEEHFFTLKLIESPDEGKDPIIKLESPNIPSQTPVFIVKGKDDTCSIKTKGALVTHEATDKKPLTDEQDAANALIGSYGKKLGTAVHGYVKEALDILRTYSEAYGCAKDIAIKKARKAYEDLLEKLN